MASESHVDIISETLKQAKFVEINRDEQDIQVGNRICVES
jgi:hypothetical protein